MCFVLVCFACFCLVVGFFGFEVFVLFGFFLIFFFPGAFSSSLGSLFTQMTTCWADIHHEKNYVLARAGNFLLNLL